MTRETAWDRRLPFFGDAATCSKAGGDGGTGFGGASVRTPVTLVMILIADLMAVISSVRVDDLFSHSSSLVWHADVTASKEASSAALSASVELFSLSASFKSVVALVLAVVFAVLDLDTATCMASKLLMARLWAFRESVSPASTAMSSSSKPACNFLRSSMTFSDLKSYLSTCFAKSPMGSAMPCSWIKAKALRTFLPTSTMLGSVIV
mmetsp:Transcript_65582/g.119589  ORF Transcript_65582/g.119589 Transcript_65582/m.119589 type:complete len:208 (-) Transcript_65582:518-1141(-)